MTDLFEKLTGGELRAVENEFIMGALDDNCVRHKRKTDLEYAGFKLVPVLNLPSPVVICPETLSKLRAIIEDNISQSVANAFGLPSGMVQGESTFEAGEGHVQSFRQLTDPQFFSVSIVAEGGEPINPITLNTST